MTLSVFFALLHYARRVEDLHRQSGPHDPGHLQRKGESVEAPHKGGGVSSHVRTGSRSSPRPSAPSNTSSDTFLPSRPSGKMSVASAKAALSRRWGAWRPRSRPGPALQLEATQPASSSTLSKSPQASVQRGARSGGGGGGGGGGRRSTSESRGAEEGDEAMFSILEDEDVQRLLFGEEK